MDPCFEDESEEDGGGNFGEHVPWRTLRLLDRLVRCDLAKPPALR
jgi:hypothetical protein